MRCHILNTPSPSSHIVKKYLTFLPLVRDVIYERPQTMMGNCILVKIGGRKKA